MVQQIKITQTSNADMNIGVPKTQTAVQWLLEIFWGNEGMLTTKQLEQAKEMEKEQIIDAFDTGTMDDNLIGNEYYNETYNKQTMANQTAVDWLVNNLPQRFKNIMLITGDKIIEQAKQMEKQQRVTDYNAGYTDAQCNHVNDAENYANECDYINHKEL